ncbi:MAG: acyl-CoA dehydrogenase family protein, partial [Burkholderiales bacterium]
MLLSPEQITIRDTLRRYSRERLRPTAGLRDQTRAFPHDELAELAEMGLMGMLVPPDWNGAGLDYLSMAVVLEELAAGDGALSTIVSVNNSVVCGPLLQFGSAEQKNTFLKPLAAGQKLGCFCLTEPQAGSDASALRTRATRKGNDYILNGSKQFITSGKNADIAIV